MAGLRSTLLLTLAVSASTFADDETAPKVAEAPPTSAAIAAAVEQLASPRFAEREAASEFLWRVGPAAQSALEVAVKSPDAEVVTRAELLLERIRWGVAPGSPPEVTLAIEEFRFGDADGKKSALRSLRRQRQFSVLSKLLALAQNDPALNAPEFTEAYLPEIRLAALDRIVADDLDQAETLLSWRVQLDSSDKARRDYVAFLGLTDRGTAAVARLRELAKRPDDRRANAVLAQWSIFENRLDEAAAFAAKADDVDLRQELEFRRGDWSALARKKISTGDSVVERIGYALMFHRLANNRREADAAVAEIQLLAKTEPYGGWECIEVLELNEQWQAVDELAATLPDEVFSRRVRQFRFDDAFSVFGLRHTTTGTAEWFRNRVGEMGDNETISRNHFELGVAALAALLRLEERAEAERLFQTLTTVAGVNSYRWGRLLSLEIQLHGREAAQRRAVALLADAKQDDDHAFLYPFFGRHTAEARSWLKLLPYRFPQQDVAQHWSRVRQLLTPGKGSPFADVTLDELAAAVEPATQVVTKHHRSQLFDAVITVAKLRDDPALAVTYLLKQAAAAEVEASEEPDAAGNLWLAARAYLEIGEIYFRRGDWKQAATAYARARRIDPHHATACYLEGHARRKLGHETEGRVLQRTAVLLPLGDTDGRGTFSGLLQHYGLDDAGLEQAELVLRTDRRLNWDMHSSIAAQDIAERIEATDPARAAVLWQDAQMCALQSAYGFGGADEILEVAQNIHRCRASAAFAEGRDEEGVAELRAAHAVGPTRMEFLEKLIPTLESTGRNDLAEEFFEASYGMISQVCERYPRAGFYRNNTAWLAARCGHRLDEALAHAEEAVRLGPDRAAYLDTLAEVRFRRGEKELAVALAERALKLDPTNEHLVKQLQRFRG